MLKKTYAVELSLVETTADVDEHEITRPGTIPTRKTILLHFAGPDDSAGAHALFHKLADIIEGEGAARRARAALAPGERKAGKSPLVYCSKCCGVKPTYETTAPGTFTRRVVRCVTCQSIIDWVPATRRPEEKRA